MPATVVVRMSLPPGGAVTRALLEGAAVKLRRAMSAAQSDARRDVAKLVALAIRSSREYASLLGGKLQAELGVKEPLGILEAVIDGIGRGIKVTSLGARATPSGLDGGMRVEILKADYSEVLGVPGASFRSEGGHDVPWLRWLTLEGDRVLVADWRVRFGNYRASRTGLAVMAQPGSWRVSPEFAGTPGANWLTRAIGPLVPSIEQVVAREIQRRL